MKRLHPAFLLLLITISVYGLLIPQLGFYWDDLPMSWIRYQLGTEAMTRYFSTNRPVWALLYQITTRLLPQVPIFWQVFALIWRWLGTVTLWAFARRLFPGRETFAWILSLAFLLYPGFNQQWGSYLYSHFFIVLFFFLVSLYLMLQGRTFAAMIFSALNLWMMEYFFVLELARPLVIWISQLGEPAQTRDRLRRVVSRWIPYLAVFVLAVLSRVFIFNNQVYGFSLRESFSESPLETTSSVLGNVTSSLWTVTFSAWGLIFNFPNPTLDGPRTTLLYVLVVGLIGGLALTGLYAQAGNSRGNGPDLRWAFILGIVLLIFGGPPFWLTNVPVSLGFPANRATLAFLLGVSMIFAGLVELLPSRIKTGVIVLLIALAGGRQFLWSNEFRRDWAYHRNMFWQMTWRAPGLEKDTLVLMNEELAYYADNSLGASLNWIYSPDNHTDHVDYALFYPTNRLGASLPALEPGLPVAYDFLAGTFEGNTSQAVVFYFAPPRCLRLLDPEIDEVNRLIPEDSLLRDAARLSSTDPILTEPIARMPDIYGPEPAQGWCYYFQKADLARQGGDWEQVASLGDVAFNLDDYPNDPTERFVFIEGYAHIGDWKKAVELSEVSFKVSRNYMRPLLCRLWSRIERDTIESSEKDAAVSELRMELECSQ